MYLLYFRNRVLDRMVFGSELNNLNGRYLGGGQTEGNDNGDGGGGGDENGGENVGSRLQALRAASCIRVLGKGVIRVVKRVDDARENNNLGECMQWVVIVISCQILG